MVSFTNTCWRIPQLGFCCIRNLPIPHFQSADLMLPIVLEKVSVLMVVVVARDILVVRMVDVAYLMKGAANLTGLVVV